eukprot:3482851-Amphidinium_carterae.1
MHSSQEILTNLLPLPPREVPNAQAGHRQCKEPPTHRCTRTGSTASALAFVEDTAAFSAGTT